MLEGLHNVLGQMGVLGYPLLFCSCLIMAIIVERIVFFILISPVSQQQVSRIVKEKPEQLPRELAASLEKGPFGQTMLELLEHRDLSLTERENYSTIRLSDLERQMTRHLPILKILSTVSPLLGLLGTVLGMINSFKMISMVDKPITPSLVSGGISQALLTTAVGLILAILALVSHSLFQMRVTQLIRQITQQLNLVNLSMLKRTAD